MDYFQGVVTEYLRADRGLFVNPEILLQLDDEAVPKKGRHWYCDLMAVSLKARTVYLCEVTYSSTVAALIKRLAAWNNHWEALQHALQRDCGVDPSWTVRPWVFLPQDRQALYEQKLGGLGLGAGAMPAPKLTLLEEVLPWRYCTWDRRPAPDEG